MLIIDGEIGDNPDPNKNKIVQKMTNAVAVSKRIGILPTLPGDVIALATFLGSGKCVLRRKMPIWPKSYHAKNVQDRLPEGKRSYFRHPFLMRSG